MIPVGVRTALHRAPLGTACCRRAELTAMVAVGGHLQTGTGTGTVELLIGLPTAAAAERLCGLLRDLAPTTQVLLAAPTQPDPAAAPRTARDATTGPAAAPSGPVWTVLARPAAGLARHVGLLNRHGQPLLGLPPQVLHGRDCCAAAVWRAALLTSPTPPAAPGRPGRRLAPPRGLVVDCPNPVIALALVGLARRLGARARIHTRHGRDHTAIAAAPDITRLLTATAGPAAAAAYAATARAARPHGGTGPAGLHGANTARARRAAADTTTQISAAFAVLGDHHPALTAQLRAAGLLRLTHPELSLTQLAALADPPLSKDTLHGRLRRLLTLAARAHTTMTLPNAQATG